VDKIIRSYSCFSELLKEAEKFAEDHGLSPYEVEIEIQPGLNPRAIISPQDWEEGERR